MIKKFDSLDFAVNEKMRGGEGSVLITHLLDKNELYSKGRLYAHVTLKPGCSIGYHVHEGEMESYFILKGKALYNDNGAEIEICAGDSTLTTDGFGHAIANIGEEDMEMIALIIFN